MLVDASALVAILNEEPDWQVLAARMAAAEGTCRITPLVRFEATAAIARAAAEAAGSTRPSPDLVARARGLVDELLLEIGATEIPITPEIGSAAIAAAQTYGKLVGHPASLNFGDCFAYAAAKTEACALLYKGNDFARTDLG